MTWRTRGRDPGGLRDQATGAGAGQGVRCEAGREVGAAYTSSPETDKHQSYGQLKGFACQMPILTNNDFVSSSRYRSQMRRELVTRYIKL